MSEFIPSFRAEVLRQDAFLVDKSTEKPGRGIVLSTSGGLGKGLTHDEVKDMAILRARKINEAIDEALRNGESEQNSVYVQYVFVDYDRMNSAVTAVKQLKSLGGCRDVAEVEKSVDQETVVFLAE